jgi:tRNA(Ile)-lysidine synthase
MVNAKEKCSSESAPLTAREIEALFAGLESSPGLLLAISGGPDSTALLVLAARWKKQRKRLPRLIAVTVDHGLRPEARGGKPTTGLQERARAARYALLAEAARKTGARHVLTAHTLDDQAETVLFRMARGSGLTGLAAMAPVTPLGDLFLVRPFLAVPKARLLATLAAEDIAFAEDPSNRDPRFARVRLRDVMPMLAREGFDAGRLGQLARRVRRAERAIETVVDIAAAQLTREGWSGSRPIVLDGVGFAMLPAEVALRLLGRAIGWVGDEGPVELGKLEALFEALAAAQSQADRRSARFRRTLAGAMVTATDDSLSIERAPARRHRAAAGPWPTNVRKSGKDVFTKRR